MNIYLPYAGKIRSLRTIALATVLSLATAAFADTTQRPAAGFALSAVLATARSGTAADIPINPQHPERYVAKRGDTLWNIASLFLQNPLY